MSIYFAKNSITTYTDVKGKCSLMFFTFGCNLKCYKCHVYKDLNTEVPPKDYAKEDEILQQIEEGKDFVDCVIFSGGEFLVYDVEQIEDFLLKVRRIFSGLIIVNTNGTFPQKMEQIAYLVDGFYLDVKCPFWLLNRISYMDREMFKQVYGIDYSEKIISKLAQSVLLLVKRKSKYDRTRTVEYPFLSKNDHELIEQTMNVLKLEHDFNEFYEET